MTHRIEVDFNWEFPVGDFFGMVEKNKGEIHSFIAKGPGGGNPCITLDFPSKNEAENFLDDYDPDNMADREYLKTLIQEI